MMHKLMTALAVCVGLSIFPSMAAAQEVVEYYALDSVGSIRVVFDQAGTITSRRDYEPFGGEVTPVTSDPKVYAGLFRDDESKLDYAQARTYQWRTGRFGSVDPVYAGPLNPQTWNRYSYALNSPLVWDDVTGMNAQALRSRSVPGCETFNCNFMLQMELWWILGGDWGGGGGLAGDYGAEPRGSGRASGTQTPVPPPPPPIFTPDPPRMPPDAPRPEPTEECQAVPSAPRGVSLNANIALAHATRDDTSLSLVGKVKWFYNQVRNKGPWDYKQQGRQYEAFGNFNVGATGSAVGLSPNVLQRGAGLAQWLSGNRGQGNPLGRRAPFGDDSPDNINIRRGIAYYQQNYKGRPCK